MTTPEPVEGRHETPQKSLFGWGGPPPWAARMIQTVQAIYNLVADTHQMVNRSLQNERHIMALSDDLKAQVAALQAEDGVIIAALNDLKSKAVGGTVTDADVQAAIDAIKAEIANVDATVQATDPTPAPPPVG